MPEGYSFFTAWYFENNPDWLLWRGGNVLGTFHVRQVSPRDSQVAYRSVYGGADTDAGGDARRMAADCARGI